MSDERPAGYHRFNCTAKLAHTLGLDFDAPETTVDGMIRVVEGLRSDQLRSMALRDALRDVGWSPERYSDPATWARAYATGNDLDPLSGTVDVVPDHPANPVWGWAVWGGVDGDAFLIAFVDDHDLAELIAAAVTADCDGALWRGADVQVMRAVLTHRGVMAANAYDVDAAVPLAEALLPVGIDIVESAAWEVEPDIKPTSAGGKE